MILLLDDRTDDRADKRILMLKDSLKALGLPCAVIKSTSVADYSSALCAFVFTPSDHYLRTVSVRCKRVPILAVNESSSRIYNNDALFFDPVTHGSYVSFITDFLHERYKVTVGEYKTGELTVIDGAVLYGISSIKLTPSERRILVLLMLCSNRWVSENEICNLCFDKRSNSGRVSVHICNLNKKFRLHTGKRIISVRRGNGYKIDEGAV